MRNRIAATLLLVFAAIPLGILLSAPDQTEPSYNGHTLTYWLEENWYGGPEVVDALQHIGTNALPFLINGIKHPEDPLPGPHSPEWDTNRTVPPIFLTVRGFKALGSQALPLVPELTRLGRDPSRLIAESALNALVLMGTNGFPPIFAALRDPTHPYRERVAGLLGEANFLGPDAEPAVVALISALKDPVTGANAARSLGDFNKVRPDLVVPALADSLKSTDVDTRIFSAESLIWFGQSAASALPNLTNALSDPDPDVRSYATNAIQSIRRATPQ